MDHPVADHAKAVMQVAAASTGVRLSDGSTNVLPVGDRATSARPGRLHARLVRRSLERGFYQGWDLHPAQLPTRFAATTLFFRTGRPSTPRSSGCAATWGTRTSAPPATSTSRRPPRPWPASCCAGSTAVRSTPSEVGGVTGIAELRGLAARRFG